MRFRPRGNNVNIIQICRERPIYEEKKGERMSIMRIPVKGRFEIIRLKTESQTIVSSVKFFKKYTSVRNFYR